MRCSYFRCIGIHSPCSIPRGLDSCSHTGTCSPCRTRSHSGPCSWLLKKAFTSNTPDTFLNNAILKLIDWTVKACLPQTLCIHDNTNRKSTTLIASRKAFHNKDLCLEWLRYALVITFKNVKSNLHTAWSHTHFGPQHLKWWPPL